MSTFFQDPSSLVRRIFIDKTRKLLRERGIPNRYACAFALATSDCVTDIKDDVCFYPYPSFFITLFALILHLPTALC